MQIVKNNCNELALSFCLEEQHAISRVLRHLIQNYAGLDATALNVSKAELVELECKFEAHPRLNVFLSERQFRNLSSALWYCDNFDEGPFEDQFFEFIEELCNAMWSYGRSE